MGTGSERSALAALTLFNLQCPKSGFFFVLFSSISVRAPVPDRGGLVSAGIVFSCHLNPKSLHVSVFACKHIICSFSAYSELICCRLYREQCRPPSLSQDYCPGSNLLVQRKGFFFFLLLMDVLFFLNSCEMETVSKTDIWMGWQC